MEGVGSRILKEVADTSNQAVGVSETCLQNGELVVLNDEQDTKDDGQGERAKARVEAIIGRLTISPRTSIGIACPSNILFNSKTLESTFAVNYYKHTHKGDKMSTSLYPLASLQQIERTPSSEDGIPADLEEDLRAFGCKLIHQAGVLLKQCVDNPLFQNS